MVVQNMAARNGCISFAGRVGKRTNSGKAVTDVGFGDSAARKNMNEAGEQVIDLARAGLWIVRIAGVFNFGGTDQHLAVPGKNEDGPAVERFGVERLPGRSGKLGQDKVRTAHAA